MNTLRRSEKPRQNVLVTVAAVFALVALFNQGCVLDTVNSFRDEPKMLFGLPFILAFFAEIGLAYFVFARAADPVAFLICAFVLVAAMPIFKTIHQRIAIFIQSREPILARGLARTLLIEVVIYLVICHFAAMPLLPIPAVLSSVTGHFYEVLFTQSPCRSAVTTSLVEQYAAVRYDSSFISMTRDLLLSDQKDKSVCQYLKDRIGSTINYGEPEPASFAELILIRTTDAIENLGIYGNCVSLASMYLAFRIGRRLRRQYKTALAT